MQDVISGGACRRGCKLGRSVADGFETKVRTQDRTEIRYLADTTVEFVLYLVC